MFSFFPLPIHVTPEQIRANEEFVRAQADKSTPKSFRMRLHYTGAQWDSFDPTLHQAGGHEDERVVSIRTRQENEEDSRIHHALSARSRRCGAQGKV